MVVRRAVGVIFCVGVAVNQRSEAQQSVLAPTINYNYDRHCHADEGMR